MTGRAADRRSSAVPRRGPAVAMAAVAVVIVVATLVAVIVIANGGRTAAHRSAAADDALTAAREGVTTLLTADPAHADRYVPQALSVTTGALHARLADSAAAVTAEIAGQGAPSTGEVVAAGLRSASVGDHADALLTVAATSGALIGIDATAGRLTVTAQLRRDGGRWRIEALTPAGASA